ncbi:MAG: PQQ-binding-like beta-propeller repeat protein [Paracoccaceae bacterium]
MSRILSGLVGIITYLSVTAAFSQSSADVFLDFDSGGHRSAIRNLEFIGDDTLVSVSEDKTGRVWDWQSGVTLRALRGQIGAANEGKILALANIPNSSFVAMGGFFAAPYSGQAYGDVRIFDRNTGSVVKVLTGLNLPVFGLAASSDGNRIAAVGQDGRLIVWHRKADDWAIAFDIPVTDGGLRAVAFAAEDRRIVTISARDGAQLWSSSGEPISISNSASTSLNLTAVAVSQAGQRFAVAGDDGSITIRNAEDGRLIAALPPRPFLPGALAFLGEDRLVVSCAVRCGDDHRSEIWDITDQTRQSTYSGHGPATYALAVANDGVSVAVAGGFNHEIHIWNTDTGLETRTLTGQGSSVAAVGIAPDGSKIGWGNDNPCPALNTCPREQSSTRYAFDLPTTDAPFTTPRPYGDDGAGMDRARFVMGSLEIKSDSGPNARLGHEVLEIFNNGTLTAQITQTAATGYYNSGYTLLPDGAGLVTAGSDGQIAQYDTSNGSLLGVFTSVAGHTDDVGNLAAATDAPRLVTGSADQTFRLWNTETRELIASFFVTATDWIIWTPQGYYLSSPDGDRLIGWHVNQGRDREARFVRARQMKRHLHSPEIVRRAIVLGDAAAAAQELRGRDDELSALLERKPMEYAIRVIDDAPGQDKTVRLEITVSDADQTAPERFSVFINDRMVADVTDRGFENEGSNLRQIIEIPVADGANEILVSGLDEQGFLVERGAFTLVEDTAPEPKGKLYLAVIGVQDFPHLSNACGGVSCNLSFPAADAAEFLRQISVNTAPMFSEMEVLALVSNQALEDNSRWRSVFDDLAGGAVLEPDARTVEAELIDFLDLPGPDDTVILFAAGHGINIGEDYYLMAGDTRKQTEDRWKRSSLVDWRRIQEAMDRAVGRRIMVLDTCHAENAYNPRLEKDAADSRIVVLSATAANNTAAEISQLGHGVFTYALLEGLRGAAATDQSGVRLFALADYVSREVQRLTSDRQVPFYHIGSSSNFLLALP